MGADRGRSKKTGAASSGRGLGRDPRSAVPAVGALLDAAGPLLARYPRTRVVAALQAAAEECRAALQPGGPGAAGPRPSKAPTARVTGKAILGRAEALLAAEARPALRPVVNATGILLHTNLGRALLAEEAVREMTAVAGAYCNLELDVADGGRLDRRRITEGLLCQLTGAEAGLVVNNNAAAVLLILDTFAKGREVIVSRGELIEIGGGFRVPDILARSGATLVSVGTTNRTYLKDYERAVTDRTAILMRSHPSNFQIVGYTHRPAAGEVAHLARERHLIAVDDLGNGLLFDLRSLGLPRETTVGDLIAEGMHLVCVSGDKLLGGPQAGIIVGRRQMVDAMQANPLYRALRVDKLILAALEATLRLYADGTAVERLPLYRMLGKPVEALRRDASALAAALRPVTGKRAVVAVEEGEMFTGGGTLPAEGLPTVLVTLAPQGGEDRWIHILRVQEPPVIARVEAGKVIFDMRTLLPGDQAHIVRAVAAAAADLSSRAAGD